MLDTGASVSLLSENMWNLIQKSDNGTGSEQQLEIWMGNQLVGVEGSPIVIRGTTKIDITLAGKEICTDVLVASGLSMQAILGLGFLEEHQCVINTRDRVLHIGGQAIPLYKDNGGQQALTNGSMVTAALKETVKLPPLSELEALAVTPGVTNHATTWLVEALPNEKPIAVAAAIVTPKYDSNQITIPIRVANLSSEAATLYKGTKIGQLVPMDDNITIAGIAQGPDVDSIPTEPPEASPYTQELLWDLVSKSGETLTSEQQHELYNLLLGFADVFTSNEDGLGRTKVLQHAISTGNTPPIRQSPRRAPPIQKEAIRNLLDKMLSKDIIKRSKSPWASPVVLVKKKDGSIRFCVDYRKLNAVTEKDAYPLPRIDDTLDTLSGSQWFSTLDLLSGYWQVEIEERDREKNSFCHP